MKRTKKYLIETFKRVYPFTQADRDKAENFNNRMLEAHKGSKRNAYSKLGEEAVYQLLLEKGFSPTKPDYDVHNYKGDSGADITFVGGETTYLTHVKTQTIYYFLKYGASFCFQMVGTQHAKRDYVINHPKYNDNERDFFLGVVYDDRVDKNGLTHAYVTYKLYGNEIKNKLVRKDLDEHGRRKKDVNKNIIGKGFLEEDKFGTRNIVVHIKNKYFIGGSRKCRMQNRKN